MNKKGFTLIELLATIVVLGLIMTIVATKGFGAFDNSKKAINSLDEKTIKEAVNVLSAEIKQCDDETNDSEDLIKVLGITNKDCSDEISDGCECLKNNLKVPIYTNIKALIDNNLIERSNLENSDNLLIITFDDKYNAEVKDKLQFKSTNEGKNSTKSITTFEFTTKSDGYISFNWNVSSEKNYDKLIVKVNDNIILSKSGKDIEGSYTKKIEKNLPIKIEFQYSKDGSINSYNDNATITDFKIAADLTDFSRYDNDSYKFEDF